jgi:hypothetical protein
VNARLARRSAVVCVALAVMFSFWKRSALAGVSVVAGGVLIAISWWAITGAVDALILRSRSETGQKQARLSLVKFFTRHAIVALAAYGMMVRLHLDPIGLLAGVSSLGVALGFEALRDVRWRRFL